MSLNIISYQQRMRVMGDNKSHVLIFKRNSERYGIYEKIIFFSRIPFTPNAWKRADHIFSIKKSVHSIWLICSTRYHQEENNTKTVKNVPKIEVVNILNNYANGLVRKSNKFIRDCAEFGVN